MATTESLTTEDLNSTDHMDDTHGGDGDHDNLPTPILFAFGCCAVGGNNNISIFQWNYMLIVFQTSLVDVTTELISAALTLLQNLFQPPPGPYSKRFHSCLIQLYFL